MKIDINRDMDFKEYTKLTGRTNAPLGDTYDNLTSLHMLMGMATEVGELIDQFKKNLAYKRDIDWFNVEEELGDLLWYISEFCNANNINLNYVMAKNIAKLHARFPDKFTTDDAINRNLDIEREILEK